MESLTSRFYKETFVPYLNLLKAQYRFHPVFDYAKKAWESKLTAQELVNGPYLEKSQIYKIEDVINSLPLHNQTITTIRKKLNGRNLWKHQADALGMLLNGKHTVVATGTSSGKTLCYQIPILDDLIRDPSPGLRAIIIYPLNALVNDQLTEWEDILKRHPGITFARFTGQTPANQLEYEERLKESICGRFENQAVSQQNLQQNVEKEFRQVMSASIPNRLNHREVIRKNPPHILVTNFSMLEYLLERPIDVPLFEKARLKFIVLDEVHAYRGVQATEIAFLLMRLKKRLGLEKLVCIATSATIGQRGNLESENKVKRFVSDLFGEEFDSPNPIYGTTARPNISKPSFSPLVGQYIIAAEALRKDKNSDIRQILGINTAENNLATVLSHDDNFYRLRTKILLDKPKLLQTVADQLWPNNPKAEESLLALLEIAAIAKADNVHEDLLPTRLHYFIKAQDGFYVCLHEKCPERHNNKPAFFVSRNTDIKVPEGECPECYKIGIKSKLIELVSCRRCGYLYGALQDLGPKRCQNPEGQEETVKAYFDSFSTELGWAADSFWTYFSVDDDLSYPSQPIIDEEDEDYRDLIAKPAEIDFCVACGKKRAAGSGDNCKCDVPHIRKIKIFHRQCPHYGRSEDRKNLYNQEKDLLTCCPNCGARNGAGLEPVRRFQESDNEMGLAMAIPFAHFQVNIMPEGSRKPKKLLCFTDHRQRAAAFPSLIEEEAFAYDMGRKIVGIAGSIKSSIDFSNLGEMLADIADPQSNNYDPDFFLPISRYPDEDLEARAKRNLWVAEVFGYFGIPDSARESAEDLGLVAVCYYLSDNEKMGLHQLMNLNQLFMEDAVNVLQILLSFMRQRKAFTLPVGIEVDSPAFGRVIADIGYDLRKEGIGNRQGWLPKLNKDGTCGENFITNYLSRLLRLPQNDLLKVAESIWKFLISKSLLIEKPRGMWKLNHERLHIIKPLARFVCNRCGHITAYSVKGCCPRKGCNGTLENKSFIPETENIVSQWVAGMGYPQFTSLRSEEHTAQINKDLAKKIEDNFRYASVRQAEPNRLNKGLSKKEEGDLRPEGVNLLSSTTTFEMGINIGDLQKILLRNAPPTSASYVQRVGRAGRGNDKNSVCVTLCRRTKYDADAWNDPARLMSGEVRTPTVFLQNTVIAQRHFNAICFSKYLKIKIIDEHNLSEVKQQIRLEVFLPLEYRANIPDSWLREKMLYFDFLIWLNQQDENSIFCTQIGRSLLTGVSGFDNGRVKAGEKYSKVISQIVDEMAALKTERKRLQDAGYDEQAKDIGDSIKNILSSDIINILAKRGFLPRYAFPLDVVALETGLTRWSRDADVELARDRGMAIAEFAPGSQVVAHKKVFTSAGLYIVSKTDKPERQWYSKCPRCEQIRTATTQDFLITNCSVCQYPITKQYIQMFIEPSSFSVRIDKKKRGAMKLRRSALIRQRQPLTHFIDSVNDDRFQDKEYFQVALEENGLLFRYNLGLGNKGFVLCPECGCSEPFHNFQSGKKHKKLRVFSGTADCTNDNLWRNVAYGHQFRSFCLIVRPKYVSSIESLAFALQKGLCTALNIELPDIGVSWRWLTIKNNPQAKKEIILYDSTPGGSGFVKDGLANWNSVVGKMQTICRECTCENSCYDCLKSYSNQAYHENLNRLSVNEYFNIK